MRITCLNRHIAEIYAAELTELHNLIPFQKWSKQDLLSDRDNIRVYKYKWDISSICLIQKRPIGLCIAFEDNDSNVSGIHNFLYIHRIVVAAPYRNKGAGTKMITKTCNDYIRKNPADRNVPILLYTPITALDNTLFESAEKFYQKIGFSRIGQKRYPNKIDAIMKASLSDLL